MSAALACPVCGEPMLEAPIAYRAHACTACGGIWAGYEASERIESAVDAELVDLADLAESRAPETGGERPEEGRKCPECGAALARQNKAKTWLDVCKFHGTWFDAGELQRVSAILQKKRERDAQKKAESEERARKKAEEKAAKAERKKGGDGSTIEIAATVLQVAVEIFAALG